MTEPLQPVAMQVVEGSIVGAVEVPHTELGIAPRRLPLWTRAQYATPMMERVVSQSTGMHLDLETAADVIELEVHLTRNMTADVDPADRLSTFIALVDGVETDRVSKDEGRRIWTRADGGADEMPGDASVVTLRLGPSTGAPRRVEIWLPHNSWVEIRGMRASADVSVAPSSGRATWVHHGSSISHCTNADDPLSTWPTIASRQLGVDLVNLGFNGQAHLDHYTAAAIRDLPADVITLKVGINIINSNTMKVRTLTPALHGFLDTIREGHPTTPIVVISPIACPIHEDIPGPTVDIEGTNLCIGSPATLEEGDGVLTLRIIRSLFEEAIGRRAETDPNLHYLDGQELFGQDDAGHLYDNLHPDGEGYRLMGDRFAALVRTPGNPLARAFPA